MFMVWSMLQAISLGVASIATGAVASRVYQYTELRVSAVRFLIVCVFFYLMIWSVTRTVFYLYIVLADEDKLQDQFQGIDLEFFDALGARGVAQISNVTRPWLSFVLLLGDAALLASSLWMFPLLWELAQLARRSMDRGTLGEQAAVVWYFKWIHATIAVLFCIEAGFVIYHGGFTNRSYRVLMGGSIIQVFALLYVIGVLFRLKLTGRQYEAVNGAHVASPLYNRLRSVMFVYLVCSLQYQIFSIYLLSCGFSESVSTILVGCSTLLFNNSGTALAMAMGCSQECVVRRCQRVIPEEYTTAFYFADPRLATALAAAAGPTAPPVLNPVFVFTDIESSSQLWAFSNNSETMQRANELHDEIMRDALITYHGYEITTCGDAFQLAFHTIRDAVEFCIDVQLRLLAAEWPVALHNLIPATAREPKHKSKSKLYFNGLRVRMGIHDAQDADGVLVRDVHPVTGKMLYTGMSHVVAADIGDVGAGGEICVTKRIARWLTRHNRLPSRGRLTSSTSSRLRFPCAVERMGQHRIQQLNIIKDVFHVVPEGLEGRRATHQRHWEARLERLRASGSTNGRWPRRSGQQDPNAQWSISSGASLLSAQSAG